MACLSIDFKMISIIEGRAKNIDLRFKSSIDPGSANLRMLESDTNPDQEEKNYLVKGN